MRRNRITQTRRAIDKAVDAIISRMGTYDIDLEKVGHTGEINVEFRIDDDLYRRVEVADLYLYTEKERELVNLERMIRARLEEAAEAYNRETEADYLERLTSKGRRAYYADIA